MNEKNFYTYKDGRKTEMCKGCLTMHIDNFDDSTFLWLLEKMDVPYVPTEWNTVRDKAFAKDPIKMNGMSVFGKYLSKMKLKQWNIYGWADTEMLKDREEAARQKLLDEHPELANKEEELKVAFERGEISEAEYKTRVSTETQNAALADKPGPTTYNSPVPMVNPYAPAPIEEMDEISLKLTEEDRTYLAMKWGRLYKPSEWVDLEKHYIEMKNSFDIQDADSEGALILCCKTYLKMNQALDIGDIDTYQKLSKVYNDTRKTAKFTAAQIKEERNSDISCFGQIVYLCELEGGFIPKLDLSIDRDIADKDLRDIKDYNRSLIEEDQTVFRQIEQYIKKREAAEEQEKFIAEDRDLNDDELKEYDEMIEEQKILDAEVIENGA